MANSRETDLMFGPRYKESMPLDVRAVLSDVDNTLVDNYSLRLPSPRVTRAFRDIAPRVPTGLATARQPQKFLHLAEHLKLSGDSILSNGAQIFRGKDGVMVIERPLDIRVTLEIASTLQQEGFVHWIQDNGVDHRWEKHYGVTSKNGQTSEGLGTYSRQKEITDPNQRTEMVHNYHPSKPFAIAIPDVKLAAAQALISYAKGYENLGVTAFIIHENVKIDGENTFEVFITEKRANKKDALDTISEMQHIPRDGYMAIGDGPNDTVLLQHAGIGVAMGNGVDAAKAVAVFIAPDIKNDGAAVAIEQLVK